MSKSSSLLLIAAFAVAVTAVFSVGCTQQDEPPQPSGTDSSAEDTATQEEATETAPPEETGEYVNGVLVEDIVEGDGAVAQKGDTVSVHYTGTLEDGTKFDSSKDRGQPFEFRIGQGRVIQGWEEGVPGMKVGGVRKLTIPPEMGYGARAVGPIPPNSTLVFEIELLAVN